MKVKAVNRGGIVMDASRDLCVACPTCGTVQAIGKDEVTRCPACTVPFRLVRSELLSHDDLSAE